MRRVVPKHLRKKALFSCDRCKTKKIACKRGKANGSRQEDTNITCYECETKGLPCTTTIKRRKRQMGLHEYIGLHYKCLLALIEGIFPEIDVDNVDLLIRIGLEMKINMPSRSNMNEETVEELEEIGHSIVSQIQMTKEQSEYEKSIENDRFVLDSTKVSHYIGPSGAVSYLTSTSQYMIQSPDIVSSTFSLNYQKIYEQEIITSSQNPMDSLVYSHMDPRRFPYTYTLEKELSDSQVLIYFNNIHPYYPFCSQKRFMELYNRLWSPHGLYLGPKSGLNTSQVCYIYMVKIMGYYFMEDTPNFENLECSVLTNTVALSISEFVLTPTVDGIICCLLLAIFYNKNKRRECAYLLLELACRQGIAIGLSRQSMVECTPDNEHQEELKRIWWVLYQQEVRISNILGRRSSIHLNEVTIEEPYFADNDYVGKYFLQFNLLMKIVHMFDDYKPRFSGLKHDRNKKRARVIAIRVLLENWLDLSNDFFAIEDPEILKFKYQLHLEFSYYNISLLFPILVNVVRNKSGNQPEDDLDINMVVDCIHYAMTISQLLNETDKFMVFNSFWGPHMSYAYHSTLCLCMGYLWIVSKADKLVCDYKGTMIDVTMLEKSMVELRNYNQRHMIRCMGSTTKVSKYVEAMLGGFKFMEQKNFTSAILDNYENYTHSPNVLSALTTNYVLPFGSISDKDFYCDNVLDI